MRGLSTVVNFSSKSGDVYSFSHSLSRRLWYKLDQFGVLNIVNLVTLQYC